MVEPVQTGPDGKRFKVSEALKKRENDLSPDQQTVGSRSAALEQHINTCDLECSSHHGISPTITAPQTTPLRSIQKQNLQQAQRMPFADSDGAFGRGTLVKATASSGKAGSHLERNIGVLLGQIRRPLSPKGRRMGRVCLRPCLSDDYLRCPILGQIDGFPW